jgi:outer membrane protein insertion porin family
MKHPCKLTIFVLLLSLLIPPAGWAAEVLAVRVEAQDGTALDAASVTAFTSIQPGDEFSRIAMAQDVKTLEKSGRFSFVEAAIEPVGSDVVVTYIVRSKPRIRSIRISGADYMGNRKVRELLELGPGDMVDDATLAVHAQKVYEKYHKRLFPYVRLTWNIQEEMETGLADVYVTVDEGRRAKVARIDFIGNEAIPAKELRKHMQQRRRNMFSWITGTGVYDPDLLSMDRGTIRKMFLDKGYLDARVGEPLIEEAGPGKIRITIPITQGRQYTVGDIRSKGITLFPKDRVMAVVKLKAGDVAGARDIETARQAVNDYFGSRGYIDTRVIVDRNADPVTHVTDLTFIVREGEKAYIRDVEIQGNLRTQDKVIRRELSVYPGDVYDEVKIRTSERRLWNLGYFDFVDTSHEQTLDPAYYDLTIEVEEKRTGQFMVGAGFSSVDNLIGFIELSQGNFDLFHWPPVGGGQKLKLRLQVGTKRTDVEVSFVEPWLFNRKLALGVDLFRHDRRFLSDDYDQRNTGGSISLSKPLARFIRGTISYGYEEIDIYDVDDSASEQIKKEEGTRTKSWMRLSSSRDTRDSVFVPTRGNETTLSATLAGGPLGADTDLYQLEARSSQYIPLWFDHVFNLRCWVSVVEEYGDSDEVPIFDRLFLGGARTLRGFAFRDVGPHDDEGEPLGGRSGSYATAEYTLPIIDNFRFAVFYDIGMVWEKAYHFDTELNSDWGIGLRIDIPGFPLRLDYAWPIDTSEYVVKGPPERREDNDRPSGRFSFMIGYAY